MGAVAALLERRPALQSLRRALPRPDWPLYAARSPAHLSALLHRHWVDAVVIGPDAARGPVLGALRRDYPVLPLLLYLPLRSDDAELLGRMRREHVAAIAIERIDEPVLPRILARCGLAARRLAELGPLADRLGLTDAFQRDAWSLLVAGGAARLDTARIARRLAVRRETLSRRFAAGGAPSLKRAIDAVRLVAAGQLLGNPAYAVADAARLIGFSSVSLLQRTARRTFGIPARQVAALTADEIAALLVRDRSSRWD